MRAPEYHWTAFDCETISITDAAEYLEPVTAPSNYKDPDKIAAYIETGTKKALTEAALDVDLARIVAIAWQTNEAAEPFVRTCSDEHDERIALDSFWRHADLVPDQRLIGFRIRTYDLPLLIRRSQLLGVPYPDVNMDRYRSAQMVDLYDRLTFNGAVDGKKLVTYCKRFGITVDDDVTGADIAELVACGDWPRVKRHASADVSRVVALARAIGAIYVPSSEPMEVI
jgi:hypothetical protein